MNQMPMGLPAMATPEVATKDPNEERRRMMMAQLLQGGAVGGSPWSAMVPAAMQLAQAFGPNALATSKG